MSLPHALNRARRIGIVAAVGLAWVGVFHHAVFAAPAHKPPHKSTPQPPRDMTDVTATIPAPIPQPFIAVDKDGNYPQFHLPIASRARMKACGLTWQDMKLEGKAADDTWREFATRCLAANDGPSAGEN